MNPAFDPMALMLLQSLAAATGDDQAWLDHIGERHRFIEDTAQRARAYGAVARVLIDQYAQCTTPFAHRQAPRRKNRTGPDPRWGALAEAITAWSADPCPQAQDKVRVARRRLYGAQRAQPCWTCTRGLIATSGVVSDRPAASTRAIREAFTWTHATRDGLYGTLRAQRDTIDAVVAMPSIAGSSPYEQFEAQLDQLGAGDPIVRAVVRIEADRSERRSVGMSASLAGQLKGDLLDTLASATVVNPAHAILLESMINAFDAEREPAS